MVSGILVVFGVQADDRRGDASYLGGRSDSAVGKKAELEDVWAKDISCMDGVLYMMSPHTVRYHASLCWVAHNRVCNAAMYQLDSC